MENTDNKAGPSSAKDEDDNKNFTISFTHKKCCLINKVRSQMSNAEKKYSCSGCTGTRWFSCWYHSHIIIIVVVLIMAWVCIIYGTVIGAALCSHMNSRSFVPIFRIPGLKWFNKNEEKVWKVF